MCVSGDVKPVASSEQQDKQMKMRLALAARLKKEVIQGKWTFYSSDMTASIVQVLHLTVLCF